MLRNWFNLKTNSVEVYQKCPIVFERAKHLDITLEHLPSYSPNLNLIERVWKFTKKHCLYGKYFETFVGFHQTIALFLSTMHIQREAELKSLLTLNFQTFNLE